MPETAWVPLPTHDGKWWQMVDGQKPELGDYSIGEYPEGSVYAFESESNLMYYEKDNIRYAEAIPPPADATRLPRRFLWLDSENNPVIDGVYFRKYEGETPVCLFCGPGLSVWKSEQWLSDHADEIEWIDP